MERRRFLKIALAVYTAMVAFLLLEPSALIPTKLASLTIQGATRLGPPAWLLDPVRVEFVGNVLVVVPAVVMASLLAPRHSWATWTAYGFVGSLTVETLQAVVLPGRSATFVDVVANTCGALLGAVVGQLARRQHSWR